ncbi:MAG TPA: dockerin type I domain-containing protein, partial [Pirellulales bacterium]
LHSGTNTIDISSVSGSTGTLFSGYQIYDAIDLVPTSALTSASVVTSITVNPNNFTPTAGLQATFTATARDQFGNIIPANFSWSAARGTVDGTGLYVAPGTSGSDTVTATSGSIHGSATVNVNTPPTVATAATANPNPVTGISTNLSVLGADDGGEGNLTYTWASTAKAPGIVSFSSNSTNAAKSTVATFVAAGSYTLTATITDSSGLSTSSNVNVVVSQSLTSISVSPVSATIVNNNTQQFTATGLDQFGNLLATQPGFAWSLDSGSVGSVDNIGLYTSPTSAIGTATVRATSGSVSGIAPVNVVWLKGDLNGDGQLTSLDVAAMMTAIVDLNSYQTQRGLNNPDLLTIADVNNDGAVDNRDMQAVISSLADAAISSASNVSSGAGSIESLGSGSQPGMVLAVAASAVNDTNLLVTPVSKSVTSVSTLSFLPSSDITYSVQSAMITLPAMTDFAAKHERTDSFAVDRFFIDFGRFADRLVATRGTAHRSFAADVQSNGDPSDFFSGLSG